MRGDHDYPYEPLAATDTPFAASLGDRAPNFNGIYGSAGSSPHGDGRSHWGDESVDRSPHAESPLPPSASGLSPHVDRPPERSLLKAGLKKSVNRSHLHQRESRARYYISACTLPVKSSDLRLNLLCRAGRQPGSSSTRQVSRLCCMQTSVQSLR